MRIIAGEFRGRKLLPPEGDVTRPITDRVKQSLFDILMPVLPGATVFDVFAGTGSMGLECLSREAKQAHFFEADRSAVIRLRKNLETLGLSAPAAIVHATDLFKRFASWERQAQSGDLSGIARADIVFLDPPYRFLRERSADLHNLAVQLAAFALQPGGIVIFRHDSADELSLPPFNRYDLRTYGGMTLEFLNVQPASGVDGPEHA